jgi:hypothetical protein
LGNFLQGAKGIFFLFAPCFIFDTLKREKSASALGKLAAKALPCRREMVAINRQTLTFLMKDLPLRTLCRT